MISSVNVTNLQFPADLLTFPEKILNGKLHFLYSAASQNKVVVESIFEHKDDSASEFSPIDYTIKGLKMESCIGK